MFRDPQSAANFDNWAPANDRIDSVIAIEDVLKNAVHTHSCACLACHGSDYAEKAGGFTAVIGSGAEAEDTAATTATTQSITPGGFLIDEIDTAGDHDWFRITLEAGETYTFSTYLLGLRDSVLTLRDADGNAIASNDDANTNARLLYSEITFTATTAGDYFLDVSGFSTSTGRYVISSSRPVDDAVAGDATTTASLTIDAANPTAGQLDQTGDRDWYEVTLQAGEIYEFTTSATGGSNDVDTTLTLRTASGDVVAYNDDSSGTYSGIRFTASESGTYYLDVGGWADGEQGDYQVTAVIGEPLREYSNDEIASQLLYGSDGNVANLRRFDAGEGDTITVNITTLNAVGQLLARESLALWTDVTGIIFQEVTGSAQITFQDTEEGAFATSQRSGNFITSATVNVSTDWLTTQGTTLDSYSFQTYIHEIGHALGLRHGGNYNGDASYNQDALYLNDSWATTVMSYFSQSANTFFADQGFSRVFAVTPMIADIVAIELAYGAVTTTRTGDNTYGVGNDTGRLTYGVGDEATNSQGNLLAFVIIDNGGIDTLNYSTFSAAQRINLNAEAFSNVGGSTGNMSIARGTVIENAIGGSGADELIGNGVANILTGGLGNDALDGGSNVDTAVFSGNMADYTVTQTSTGVFQISGPDGVDTLTAIEFAQFDDQMLRLLPGTGVSVNFSSGDPADYAAAMELIRDFDGNDLGGDGSWRHIGSIDINGDGDADQVLVNGAIGRFATVATGPDGLVYFDDHSWAGETRVVGIYIDPLVESGDVVAGSDFDSQRRFQNDLQINNINGVLGADDYDGDGVWEVYFSLTDGTAYLRALMHADGNIRYANYQSEQQVRDYLTSNGYDDSTFGSWFSSSSQSANATDSVTFVSAIDDEGADKQAKPEPVAAELIDFAGLAAGFLTEGDEMEMMMASRPMDHQLRPFDEVHAEFFG
ncbi:M10 family metallopeptidase C-terminal domain-containing protein [uncultured Erythrobacter sp.]|uniref:M10 family metallopeptidase C-terminal domain-containing protein n=1 Tax=uncultured Erythrobacter sp. TaxID=263913 RepID=UPI00260418CC|nr:M10 family metallopeptidase C-terminal domain-containing protein [uncultured Erythrobacter sp.]